MPFLPLGKTAGRAASAFLVLEGLTKRFGDHLAVDGLSLTVEQGEFISLLGPSGCGKTTTLQMIAGFVEATSGSVLLEGYDLLATKPSERGLGVVFQSYALFPHLTAAENVAFGLEMRKVPKAERDARVQDALQLVGLARFADRYPRRMSGGQQQRVALARALVIRPRILLLDEPLSNLDAKLREEMRKVPKAERDARVQDALQLVGLARFADRYPRRMSGGQQQRVALARALVIQPRILLLDEPLSNLDAKLREEMQIELRQIQRTVGTTTLLVTHDQAEAMALSDRVVVMNAGRVEQIGRPHEVYERPVSAFVASFLGKTNVIARAALGPGLCYGNDAFVTVRPEKITFTHDGVERLAGRIATRIFQGNHWLYQVDTAAGLVTVIRQNSGEPAPEEGENVHLTWDTRHGV